MKCSYCQKTIIRNLTIKEIFLLLPKENMELCEACRKMFSPISTAKTCIGCQKTCSAKYCSDCLYWKKLYPTYDFHHEALFEYEENFSQWMKQYKISGDYRLKNTFKKEIVNYLRPFLKQKYLICPLPLSRQRYQERGFNQVTAFLQAAGIPYVELIGKEKHFKPQAEKKREERLRLKQPFHLCVAPEVIHNQRILLVDDIYTTGRTIFHAASLLLAENPLELRSFSLAR